MIIDRRSFLLLGGVALVGCSSTSQSIGQSVRPAAADPGEREALTSLAMVGDSITEASTEAIAAALATIGFDDVRIDGERSRRIEVGDGRGGSPLSGVKTLYSMLAEGVSPSVWVIALGTNDVGSYADEAAYGALVDLMIMMLPPATPLVWIDVYRPQNMQHTEMFNDVLRSKLALRGKATVADWFAVASQPNQTVLRSDDIHPNDNGEQAFALVLAQALQRL